MAYPKRIAYKNGGRIMNLNKLKTMTKQELFEYVLWLDAEYGDILWEEE